MKVPGPAGKAWGASTINGNWRRGTGILNNELYIGRLIWNRLSYIKNPDTGKRVSRLNPESEWIIKDVPELRIVNQELWEKVKTRQQNLRHLPEFHERQRPRKLLSYLLKCGCCGGGFSKVSAAHYGCSAARNKGEAVCSNRAVIRQDELEGLVLAVLQKRLMDPALLEEFCDEYTKHLNRLRSEKNAGLAAANAELSKLAVQKERLIQAIKDGIPASELKDDLASITTRRETLETQIDGRQEEPIILHPGMADHFRAQVARLTDTLNADQNRVEAADLLRSLVDRIELTPNSDNKLEIDLYGDLAGILSMAGNKGKQLDKSDPAVQQVKMVAGVGFEPTTFRL